MSEFFTQEEVKGDSPRVAWMKKHDLCTVRSQGVPDDEEPWNCWAGKFSMRDFERLGATGATEDEAITRWAIKNGVRLWNETVANTQNPNSNTQGNSNSQGEAE